MKEITCRQCGAVVEVNDSVLVEDEYVCMDCYSHEYFTCENCGRIYLLAQCNTVNSGTNNEIYVCDNCTNYYSCCDGCSNHFSNEHIWAEDGGTCVCHNCSDNYRLCDECGDIINADYAYYDNSREQYYCEACYHEQIIDETYINDYYYKPDPVFLGTGNLYLGVELEVDCGNNMLEATREICETTDDLYLKHDGSLGDVGFEIVSHPATLDYHMNKFGWDKLMNICIDNNYKSHDTSTCGLHIHVNRKYFGDYDDEQDLNIAKVILLFDRWWDKYIVPFSRRNSENLSRWSQKPNLFMNNEDTEESIISKVKGCKNDGRYQAVNLSNETTIEFRLFKGTLKFSTFLAALQFVVVICTFVKNIKLADLMKITWKKVFSNTEYNELNQYLKEKNLM